MKFILSLVALFCVYLAITASVEAGVYRAYYEAFRSEHEAFIRTIGHPIDTMYTCKLKK